MANGRRGDEGKDLPQKRLEMGVGALQQRQRAGQREQRERGRGVSGVAATTHHKRRDVLTLHAHARTFASLSAAVAEPRLRSLCFSRRFLFFCSLPRLPLSVYRRCPSTIDSVHTRICCCIPLDSPLPSSRLPVAMDGGDSAMDASAPAASPFKPPSIVVYLAGQPAVHVDLQALDTYADMRADLNSVHGIDMENKVIVDEFDNSSCIHRQTAAAAAVAGGGSCSTENRKQLRAERMRERWCRPLELVTSGGVLRCVLTDCPPPWPPVSLLPSFAFPPPSPTG